MHQLSKFAPKQVLGTIWFSGSAALVFGLIGFPLEIRGKPFLFMEISIIFVGVSTLLSLISKPEPKYIFSEIWARMLIVYSAWGFVLLGMRYLPLHAGIVAMGLMVLISFVIFAPTYWQAYCKIRDRYRRK